MRFHIKDIHPDVYLHMKDIIAGGTQAGILVDVAAIGNYIDFTVLVDDVGIEINGSNQLQLKDLGVKTAKLDNLGVTTAKLNTLAVTTAKIDNLSVTTGKINTDAVDKTKINADVAGDGLTQNVDGSLEVNPDNLTLEIDTDILRIKTNGINNTHIDWGFGANQVSCEDIPIPTCCASPTYTQLQEFINVTNSAGKISGGEFTDMGSGVLKVTAGTGLLRTTDSDTSELKFFNWAENASITLTANVLSYIVIDYNNGTPIIKAETSDTSNGNTIFLLGFAFRGTNIIHSLVDGQNIINPIYNIIERFNATSQVFKTSGGIISEVGTRNLYATAAILWSGLTKTTTNIIDTSDTDTFKYLKRDGSGGWDYHTEVATQTDNAVYDDGDGTPASLGVNKYRTDFFYIDFDGHLVAILGTNNSATLAAALNIEEPINKPHRISSFASLLAKVVTRQGATDIEKIENILYFTFTTSGIINHNDLAGLNNGDYKHLTAAEYTNSGSAYSHISSSGSSHTFINQDVTTTGEVKFKSINQEGYSTNYANDVGEVGYWTKLATVRLYSRYAVATGNMEFMGASTGDIERLEIAKACVRVKQQSAMGNAPFVEIKLLDCDFLTTSNFKAVLTINTVDLTEVIFYISYPIAWQSYKFIVKQAYPEYAWTIYNLQSNSSSLPAGVQFDAKYSDLFCNSLEIKADNESLKIGAGGDATISYNGTDMIINSDAVGSGGCIVNGLNVDKDGFIRPVSSTDAAAPANSFYYSTDASKLVYKDSGSTVNNLY